MAPRKTDRIEIRVAPEQRQMLEQAAWYEGLTLSAFVLGVAAERAEQVTDTFRGTAVSPEKFAELLAWLDEPPVANAKLTEGFRRLRELRAGADTFE